ncbi:MAG: serine protease [Nannocystaceae bacterium]
MDPAAPRPLRWKPRTAGGLPLTVALALGTCAMVLGGCAGRARDVGGVSVHSGGASHDLGVQEIAYRGANAVAEVTTDISRGLAFVVDPSGYLITNRHVIEDCDHIEEVTFPALNPPRTFASVRIIYIDPARDLALLKVDADEPLPSLPLATMGTGPVEEYVKMSDRVLLLSRTDARDASFIGHAGRVAELGVENPAVGSGPFLGLSNDVRRGQSGGPVLDRFGRAVGVVTWTWRHRVGGYAIPIAEATRMLLERPAMDTDAELAERATMRATRFVDAVYTGHLDQARRMLSPSYARKVRSDTLEVITAQVTGPGQKAVGMFFAALEDLATDLDDVGEGARRDRFQDMVVRTGSREFRESLGLGDTVSKELIVSFFFELGQAYLSARHFGHDDPPAAMEFAIDRLRTLDAARTFVFAELSTHLSDGPNTVAKVEVIPGVYAPQAVVTLKPKKADKAEHLVLQMRMEWGDWYIAQVQTVGGAS